MQKNRIVELEKLIVISELTNDQQLLDTITKLLGDQSMQQNNLEADRKINQRRLQQQSQSISEESQNINNLQTQIDTLRNKLPATEPIPPLPIATSHESTGTGISDPQIQLKQSQELANHYAADVAKIMLKIESLQKH